jgi:hypothetical protein
LGLRQRLEIVGLAFEDRIERAGSFTCRSEGAVERSETGAHPLERGGEVHAVAHQLADAAGDILEAAEFLAVLHRLERRFKLKPRPEHVRKLLGEHDHLRTLELERTVGRLVVDFLELVLRGRLRGRLGWLGRCRRVTFGPLRRTGSSRSRLFQAHRLQAAAVEHAQGLGPIRGIHLSGLHATGGTQGFVREDWHGG